MNEIIGILVEKIRLFEKFREANVRAFAAMAAMHSRTMLRLL
jgi:hypothetical protein